MSEDRADVYLDVQELPADEEGAAAIGGQPTLLVQQHEHDDGQVHVQVLVGGGMAAEDLEDVLAGLLHLVRHPQVQVQMAAASIVNNATEETGK